MVKRACRCRVVLIDEIDKADIEFPNDLLRELDRMEFHVYETRETIRAVQRPLVVITSNNEKELPDAFLRRCFFHYIKFPDRDTMAQIVNVHYPTLKKDLLKEALEVFFGLRDIPGLKKKPSTSELIDWLKLLVAEDIPPEARQDLEFIVRAVCEARFLEVERDSACVGNQNTVAFVKNLCFRRTRHFCRYVCKRATD